MNEFICVLIIIGVVGVFCLITKFGQGIYKSIVGTIKWNIKRIKWNKEQKRLGR